MSKAEQPPKKLTKAEAGRLGGLRTKQRHGSEHYRRAGALGAKAVLEKYGPDHMRQLGKAGFRALATKIGAWNPRDVQSGRSRAIDLLAAKGKLKPRWRQFSEEELAAMDEWVDATFEEMYRQAFPADEGDPQP